MEAKVDLTSKNQREIVETGRTTIFVDKSGRDKLKTRMTHGTLQGDGQPGAEPPTLSINRDSSDVQGDMLASADWPNLINDILDYIDRPRWVDNVIKDHNPKREQRLRNLMKSYLPRVLPKAMRFRDGEIWKEDVWMFFEWEIAGEGVITERKMVKGRMK